MAKVRIEIDLLKQQPEPAYVGQIYEDAPQKGFVQKLEYEGIPKYCKFCRKLGRNMINCRVLERKKLAESNDKEINKENEENEQHHQQIFCEVVQELTNIQDAKKQEAPNWQEYANGSTSVLSEVKAMPGINLVVDFNLELEQEHIKKKQVEKELEQQIEVNSPNRVGLSTVDFWTKQPTFKKLVEEVIDWEAKMQHLEEQDLNNNTAISREALTKGHAEYIKWMRMQDTLLKQKDKVKWFEDGDSNTSYFHSLIRDRRRKLQLHKIMDHRNIWVEGDESIGQEEDNTYLTTIPDMEEITEVVFNMSASSSAGPDVESPTNFSELRPISLSNFTSKIIFKILSRRLNLVLDKLISDNQSGFVKGRLITKNILLAQEIVQNVNQSNRGGNVIIKLDMAKAYDRMSWSFLMSVMRKFGFSEQWIDLIWGLVNEVWYYIIINGVFTPFTMDHRGPIINHLAYTDDIIIFYGGNNGLIKLIKSQIRRKNVSLFDRMLVKIVKKLNGWQGKLMSTGGKIILLKHILQSMPTYILSAMNPPKGTMLMEKHFVNFFWGSVNGKNKYHWSSWHNMCIPKEVGGVGIRRIDDIIETFNMKRLWRFRTHPSL
ncbi:uncharacterized protein [Nicotiana tomentosiformis]|uniref:uncharacterized protein n=1 Tax=Nicotiana tomentosiformis TaxID=4098 RepID=UPI00388CD96F